MQSIIRVDINRTRNMNSTETIDLLNRLMAIHYRSLPMYLSHAPPWKKRADERAVETLADIIADQREMCRRFADEVERLGGTIETGEFPTQFTDLHFLSLNYLTCRLIEAVKQDVARIEKCVAEADDSQVKALAEESLGMAKGHLELLEELAAKTTDG